MQLLAPGRKGWDAGERALGRRAVGWGLVGLLALLYTAAYVRHPLNPGAAPAELRAGWWSWSDQFVYWRSAAELARFQLTAPNYYYPLGYPALGAPWFWLLPGHPFFLPDLALVLGAAGVWWRLARQWLGRIQTLGTGVVFVALHAELLQLTLVIPWNTIATQLLLLAGIWTMVATRERRTVWQLSALAAAAYLVRPGDAASFAPMLAWSALRLPGWRAKIAGGAAGAALIGLAVGAVALVNCAVFGATQTPYEHTTWRIGFGAYPLAWKFHWLFVDGRPFFGEADTALLFRYPWLFLVLPGMIAWVRTSGGAAVASLLAVALNWTLYAAYNDFAPSALFRYSLVHYLAWAFPLLFALAVAGLVRWRDRASWLGWGLGAAGLVFALGLQLEERPLPVEAGPGRLAALPAARPLWVKFPGVPLERVTDLRLDGRELLEAADYQIPYVPADLRLLLSARAQGAVLAAKPDAAVAVTPVAGDYVWRWHFAPPRW